jgi:predicted PurR-regulated permease PerM
MATQKVTTTPENPNKFRIANSFEFGFLGGLGVLAAILVGQSLTTLATVITYMTAAIFIALGLDPLVRKLEARKLSRSISILSVVLVILALATALLVAVIPTAIEETGVLVKSAPSLLQNVSNLPIVETLDSQFNGAISNALGGVSTYLSDSKNWPVMLGGVVQVGINLVNGVVGFVVIVTLSLYFMASLGRFKKFVYALVPASRRGKFSEISEEVAASVGRYVGGQATIAIINASLGFIVMSIFGVPYSIVLAFFCFLLALIPLVGAISGASLVTLVALTVSPSTALFVGIYYLIYMQVEAYVISPRVMKRAVSVPGGVVVVAAMAGGALLGIMGALVAIPVAASVILILRQVWMPRQDKL